MKIEIINKTNNMKKIITLSLVLFGLILNAQNHGKVIIYTNLNQPFLVSLNGIRVNNQYLTKTTFDYVEESECKVKVWFQGAQYPVNFVIQNATGFESMYQLAKDNFGAFTLNLISKVVLGSNNPVTTVPTVPPTPTSTVPATPVTPVIKEMDAASFTEKLNTVKNESFDDSKLEKAKFVFDDEYLSSSQVASVAKAFSFETKKVEWAKFAYKRTVDKKNYFKVVDVLTFDVDKRDLQNWIKKNP